MSKTAQNKVIHCNPFLHIDILEKLSKIRQMTDTFDYFTSHKLTTQEHIFATKDFTQQFQHIQSNYLQQVEKLNCLHQKIDTAVKEFFVARNSYKQLLEISIHLENVPPFLFSTKAAGPTFFQNWGIHKHPKTLHQISNLQQSRTTKKDKNCSRCIGSGTRLLPPLQQHWGYAHQKQPVKDTSKHSSNG